MHGHTFISHIVKDGTPVFRHKFTVTITITRPLEFVHVGWLGCFVDYNDYGLPLPSPQKTTKQQQQHQGGGGEQNIHTHTHTGKQQEKQQLLFNYKVTTEHDYLNIILLKSVSLAFSSLKHT